MAQGNKWVAFDDDAEAVTKALGVKPVLARRVGAAGRGSRRNLTGDRVNLRRVIGKAYALPPNVARQLKGLSAQADQQAFQRARPKPLAVKKPRYVINTTGQTGGFGKARSYDPDARRSARQGAAAGVAGVAGGGLVLRGGQQIYIDGNPARGVRPFDPGPAPQRPTTRAGETTRTDAPTAHGKERKAMRVDEVRAVQRRAERETAEHAMATARHGEARAASETIANLRRSRGRFVSGRGAAQVVGGAALLGGAAGLHRKAKEAPYR